MLRETKRETEEKESIKRKADFELYEVDRILKFYHCGVPGLYNLMMVTVGEYDRLPFLQHTCLKQREIHRRELI